MTIGSREAFRGAYRLTDLSVMLASFCAALYLVGHPLGLLSMSEILKLDIHLRHLTFLAIVLPTWLLFFGGFGLYRSRRLALLSSEFVDLAIATFFCAGTALIVGRTVGMTSVTEKLAILFWFISLAFMITWRSVGRLALRHLRVRGLNQRHVLVAGTNQRAVAFVDSLLARPELGYKVIGFVDDEWSHPERDHWVNIPLLCSLEGLQGYIEGHVVDEVVIALPMASHYSQAAIILAMCEEQGILVRCLSGLFDTTLTTRISEAFGEECLTTFHARAMDTWGLGFKRLIDVVGSSIMLVLISPLLVAVSVLIRLTSSGPILFRQVRTGLHKRPFTIYKFRTMVQDAEQRFAEVVSLNEDDGPSFKIKKDPRITPIGKILRKLSIDELPQLLNVLKGEMSLVGPRPLFMWEYDRIKNSWIRRRFSIRPGLTGLWQVSGRSNLNFDQRIQLDLAYIDNWSLWLDVKLLMRTIPVVFLGKGAV